MGGRIRVTASMDVGSIETGAKKAERSIDNIGDAAHRTNAKLDGTSVSFDRVSESTDRYSKNTRTASRDTDSLSKHIQGVNARFTGMRNAVSLIKWPALISGAGYAAEGLGSLSAGAVALTSALAPLSGALLAYPALLGSFAQGLGVAQLAVGGVKSALGEMSKEQVGAGETAKQSAKAQEAAAEGVRSAERQLTQAQVGAKRAQTELTQARKEAVENLKDLKNAAVDAGFGEQRAAMSLHDAKAELKKALAEPGQHTNSELESLELGVKEARQGLKEARLEKHRADREASKGEKQGVTGSPKYLEAKRQLGEANLQAAEAARGLVTAEKAQKEALEESGGAAGKLASKLESLPAATQKFAKYLFSLKPQLKALQGTAANGLLPGVEGGIQSALKLFPRLKSVVGDTGKVMGGVAKRAGELIGSKGFGRDFSTIAEGNTKIIGRMGNSGLKLADALRHVLVAGQPLLMWMAKSGEHFATWLDNSAKAGRESGKLAGFFDKTRGTMEVLGSIFKNVATGLLEIGKAAYPLGNSILKALNGQAEDFAGWTQSLEGKNALRDYFQQAKPGIFEVGRLIKDLGGAFLGLSNNEGFYNLTHEVRTQLVPVFKELLEGTTKALGPALVQGLVQLGKLFGSLGGANGPLVGFVNAVTGLFKAGNWMVENIPGFKTLAITIGGIVAVSKAMKFVGMVSGLSTALDFAKRLLVTMGAIETESKFAGGAKPFFGAAPQGVGVGRTAVTTAETTAGGAVGGIERTAASGAAGGALAATLAKFGIVGGAEGAILPVTLSIGSVVATHQVAQKLGHKTGSSGSGIPGLVEGILSTVAGVGSPALSAYTGINELTGGGAPGPGSVSHKLGSLTISKKLQERFLGRDQFKEALVGLSTDAIAGMGKIKADLSAGLQVASGVWKVGTNPWRQHTAEAMEGAVRAIRSGINDGTITAKSGQQQISKLLEQIHITKGDDPFGLAQATTKSFKQANQITASGVKTWIDQLAQMPKASRESSINSTQEILKGWAEGHPRIEKQIEGLTDFEIHKFGATNKQLREGVKEGATGPVAEAFKEAAEGVGGALSNIGTNTSRMLKALGLKDVIEFQALVLGPSHMPSLHGEAAADAHHHPRTDYGPSGTRPKSKNAATGYLPGKGLGDTIPIWAAPGEAILNRHQQAPVNAALQSTFGIDLDGLFKRIQTPHYMAQGGQVKVSGAGALAKMGHAALSRAVDAANSYIAKHRPHPGVGGSLGSSAASGSVADHPELQPGISAIVATILKRWPGLGITSTTGGTHATDSLHYQGRAADLASPMTPSGIKYMLDAAGWIKAKLGRNLTEGIHDPNLSVKYGHEVSSSYWGEPTWAEHLNHIHVGKARGGFIQSFNKGGYTSSDIKHSGTLSPQEWAIAMLLGGFPAKPGVIAAGLGTIKSESSFNASSQVPGNEHEGGWALSDAFGSTAMKLNPILSSKAAFAEWKKDGGFWQAWGQWEAEQGGLSGGGAGAYGPEFMSVAGEVIKGMGGTAASGGKSSKPKVKKYPAGHTSSGGGTYGQKAPAPGPAGSAPMHEVHLAGLAATALEPAAHALPASIQAMLSAPGLTFAQKLSIGELAGTLAGNTQQRTFDAEGHETSADSHADDIAAASFQKPLVQGQKQNIEKRLRKLAKELKSKGLTTKERRQKEHEQAELLGKLGNSLSTLQGLDETIHLRPEAPGGGEGEGSEGPSKAQEEEAARQQEIIELLKQQAADQQRTINVIQSNSGSIISSLIAVINGGIGGKVGLGMSTPSVAGSLASY